MRTTAIASLFLFLATPALAGRHFIEGQVLTRNGEPVDRAIVSLEPGFVELVTDREGRFLIDYLRKEDGSRTKMSKKTVYTLEIYKPGYHVHTLTIDYRKGPLVLDLTPLVEESVELREDETPLDPNLYTDRADSTGVSYEGQ
ncbi:MAG: carboxypeptidase regulatory-like domain-containing protein [Deltaproteobacteria bacterium]|nr:MAG: carboxypeptidase regulatory-like domain-containing protein [Deltaproteobacteria bacterium]